VGCPAVLNSPRVTSDTARFRVIQPQGREKEALDRLREIATLERPDTEDSAFLEYQELADRYPKSVYAPKALDAAAGVYFYSQNLEQRRRVIPVCMRLIEEYPDSYYFILAFTKLVHTYEILKDKEGAIKTMQELIKKHPESKISERAEYWLERIEKWEFE
jgi:outer membrane protein assembly factor BamD (BamD/ComL family)